MAMAQADSMPAGGGTAARRRRRRRGVPTATGRATACPWSTPRRGPPQPGRVLRVHAVTRGRIGHGAADTREGMVDGGVTPSLTVTRPAPPEHPLVDPARYSAAPGGASSCGSSGALVSVALALKGGVRTSRPVSGPAVFGARLPRAARPAVVVHPARHESCRNGEADDHGHEHEYRHDSSPASAPWCSPAYPRRRTSASSSQIALVRQRGSGSRTYTSRPVQPSATVWNCSSPSFPTRCRPHRLAECVLVRAVSGGYTSSSPGTTQVPDRDRAHR